MTNDTDDADEQADEWAEQLNDAADDGGGCPEMFREAFEQRSEDDDGAE